MLACTREQLTMYCSCCLYGEDCPLWQNQLYMKQRKNVSLNPLKCSTNISGILYTNQRLRGIYQYKNRKKYTFKGKDKGRNTQRGELWEDTKQKYQSRKNIFFKYHIIIFGPENSGIKWAVICYVNKVLKKIIWFCEEHLNSKYRLLKCILL